MKIGIGITSYNRPDHLRFCIEQILKHTQCEFKLFVYNQSDEYFDYSFVDNISFNGTIYPNKGPRKGIAYAKNMCLYNLRDCDIVYLFDDDCFPKKDGWEKNCLLLEHHNLHLTNRHRPKYSESNLYMEYYESSGCFMAFSREALNDVGYFNSDYKGYGFEHSGMSYRIYRAGRSLTPFKCLNRTGEFIHSLDLDGPFDGFDVEHKPSLSYSEMNENMEHNRKVYETECTTGEIYKDFNP